MESSLTLIREIIASLPLASKHYGYGTAGFRDKYTESIHVVFVKVGILAALRSLTVQGAAIGVMVTASHNPKEDNGVKIVDPDGGMLTRTWETAAEELVNSDVDGFIARLTQFIQEKNITPLQKKPLVVVGSDCRDHSPILSNLVKKGVEAVLGGICIDVGNVTTPLLHYVVASVNNEGYFNPLEFNREKFFNLYFEELLSGFSDLAATADGKSGSNKPNVILDTAYGVGSVTTTQFLDYARAKGLNAWEIEIRNKVGEGPVNEDCGAEHCQKLQIPCAGVASDRDHSQLLCSFDGDADRIVFHAFLSSNPASWVLLDGDRIAALIANFLFAELTHAEIIDKVDMGVVQTAYANGSSTLFLKDKGVKIYITKTGVKYLHHKAHELDVGIYFEANGHGTVLFSEKFRQLLQAESENPTENERKALAIRRLKVI
jgi:phosphoacetylglucosamine mutase